MQTLQPRLNDLPLGGVDHKGNARDLGLAGQQLQVARHGRHAVDHALVHADVYEIGAILHLLPGHVDRFLVLAFLDQLGEFGRAGDIGALADIDKIRVGPDGQRLQAA